MADRVNFGRKRSDINQSQNTSLPKAPKLAANTKFTGQSADLFSKLEASILEKLTAANEYSRELTSRNTDAVMERIHSALAKLANELPENSTESQAGLTAKDIESLKKEISDQIAKSDEKLSSTLKDYIQAQVSSVLNNETAANAQSEDSAKLVDTLKALFEQQSKIQKLDEKKAAGNTVVAEKSESKEDKPTSLNAAKLDTSISNQEQLHKYMDAQFSQLHEKFQNLGDSFKNSSIFGFKNPLAGVVGKITSPFKTLGDSFKELGKKVGDGFKAIGAGVMTALASPFKLLGAGLSALNPFKKKKKGPNDTKEMLKLLKKMDKSFQSMEMVFTDFIGYLVKNFKTFLDKVSGVVEKFWLGLLLKTIVPTMLIIGAVLYLLADPLMKVLQPVMDFVGGIVNKIIDFIAPLRDFILNNLQKVFDEVLHPLLRGIGFVAEDLGKALGKLVIGIANFAVDVLMPFLKDKLLPVLGAVLDIMKEFFKALQPWIKPLGDVVMKTLVTIMDILGRLLKEVGEMIIDITKIIRTPITMIKDFFEGFGSNAKKIGEKVSEAVLKSLDIILEVLDMIKNNIGNLFDFVRQYVAAPLMGLKRWINSEIVRLAESFWVPTIKMGEPNPDSWGITQVIQMLSGMHVEKAYPFKDSLPTDMVAQARADAGKSVSELISEEMGKMSAKIEAEKKAKALDELNKSLQQKNMQALLDNVNVIGDIYTLVKEIHADMFGQEHTDSLLAVQAVAPNLQTLQNVNAAYSAAGKSIAEDIDASKQEAGDKQQGITLQGLYDAMKNMFEPVPGALEQILEKLDNPQIVPLPLSQPANLAAMEDN